jgi:hypothetical protein
MFNWRELTKLREFTLYPDFFFIRCNSTVAQTDKNCQKNLLT